MNIWTKNKLLKLNTKKNYYSFKINLIGKIQIKNILMAMIAAEKSNIKFKDIVKVISKLIPVDGRLEKNWKN